MSAIPAFFKKFFEHFGLSFVMVASYFGAGSIFIASQAGVEYGYVLIWAVVGAVLLGFMAQDMSARLGMFGVTLMDFIRIRMGKKFALIFAIFLSIGCVLWAMELAGAVGMSVEVLTGGAASWQVVAVATMGVSVLTGIMDYSNLEKFITAMMAGLLILYAIVAGASEPNLTELASGFIPSLPDERAFVLGAAILGTTALWPNFFLESILVKAKGWNSQKHLRAMRLDLVVGYAAGGVITVAVVVVAAAVLRPNGVTELVSFIAPGEALAEVMGPWAKTAFLIGVIAASYNSIVPILWTVPFMILSAVDHPEPDQDSRAFKRIYIGCSVLSAFVPLIPIYLGLGVLDMILLFPAYNGVVGLPLTAVFLFWAVNDKRIMGEHTNSKLLNVFNFLLVIFSCYIAVKSGRGVFTAIFG